MSKEIGTLCRLSKGGGPLQPVQLNSALQHVPRLRLAGMEETYVF